MPIYQITAHNNIPNNVVPATTRLVNANAMAPAIHWLLDNEESFSWCSSISIDVLGDVVDLTTKAIYNEKPKRAPAVMSSAAGARKPKKAVAQSSSEYTCEEVMQLTGLKNSGVYSRRHNGSFEPGITRGSYTKASVTAWIEAGGIEAERKKHADRARKAAAMMRERKLSKRQAKATKPLPKPSLGEDFQSEERLAKELNLDIPRLRIIKAQGQIEGGYGWIDRTALLAYMASDEYQAPL